jgi:hypothetical protein
VGSCGNQGANASRATPLWKTRLYEGVIQKYLLPVSGLRLAKIFTWRAASLVPNISCPGGCRPSTHRKTGGRILLAEDTFESSLLLIGHASQIRLDNFAGNNQPSCCNPAALLIHHLRKRYACGPLFEGSRFYFLRLFCLELVSYLHTWLPRFSRPVWDQMKWFII